MCSGGSRSIAAVSSISISVSSVCELEEEGLQLAVGAAPVHAELRAGAGDASISAKARSGVAKKNTDISSDVARVIQASIPYRDRRFSPACGD
jgi:hypothetical protein